MWILFLISKFRFTRQKMQKPNDYMLVVVLINLLSSNILCESLLHQPFEVKSEQHSNYPLQPELVRIFENCHKNSSNFDPCVKTAFNELRVYFKSGKFLLKKAPKYGQLKYTYKQIFFKNKCMNVLKINRNYHMFGWLYF